MRRVFERFTDRARQVVVLAQEEARELQHNYIGTEHMLLGLLREEEGLAAQVLASLGVTLPGSRDHVLRIVGSGEEIVSGQIPFTPRAKKVLELALRESRSLGEHHIDTEHILLGIARENEGVASRILLEFDTNAERVRAEVVRSLSSPRAAVRFRAPVIGERQPRGPGASWLGGLDEVLARVQAEIREELGREPDDGDLLLALACATDGLAGRALGDLGVDPDALWAAIEALRRETLAARDALGQRIEATREAKERAIEAHEFQTAARLRDEERALVQQARARAVAGPEVGREIRRRLGLPGS